MTEYSHSRLTTFENCPMAYKLKYIVRLELEEGFETVEAFMGSRVHEALRRLYEDLMHEKLLSLEELLEYFRKIWEKNWSGDVRVIKEGLTPEHYRLTGERCISDYYRRYAPFDQGKTLALEHKVTINIGGYKLKGFIDRLAAFPDGLYEIHDYKTSRTLPAQPQLDADRQLALYQIGIQQQWEDVRRVDLVWHYLFHDKELRSKRTEEQLEELKREVLSVIHQIERAEELDDFPPRRDYCQWCEFQGVCPEWSHERRVLELPRNEFMKEPGVRLVDQYAEVKRKAAELAELEKKLREAIVAYAKREGVTSIRGSNCRLYVRIEKSEKFPGAREEGREELEEVIKEAGRWEEVSMLDVRALAGVVRRAEWPAELLEKLRPFQRLEESVQLRLGKLKEEE